MNVVKYQKLIAELEDRKLELLMKHGECEYVIVQCEQIDRKLAKLYDWLLNSPNLRVIK